MRSRRCHRGLQALAAGCFSLVLALTLLPQSALAGYQMTKSQSDEIKDVTAGVAKALVLGGKGAEESQQAVYAVQAGLITGYSQGLSNAEAAKAIGPIADPYLKRPGPDARMLTPDDIEEIEKHKTDTARIVKGVLPEREANAIAYTAEVAMKNHLKAHQVEDSQRTTDLIQEAAKVIRPFTGLPPITSPESPFVNGIPTFSETAAAASPPPPPPAPGPPVDANGSPIDVNDENAATVTGDHGEIIQARPDGNGGTEFVESVVGDQNGNNGNSRGKDKDDKKDKDSGGKNSSNNSGSGNNNSSSNNSGHHP